LFQLSPEVRVGLDIQRILDPTQVLDLAPILADLLKAALATAPSP